MTAVKNFSLEIGNRETVCLAGPNGSGKTTILNCILGILKSTKGEILLDGRHNDSEWFKGAIAYVPDDLLIIEELTGREYLDFVSAMYEKESRTKKIGDIIDLFGMKGSLDQPIETYSHGMKKKIQLISAFVLETKFIILDEPFRGLDIESVIITKRLMKKFITKGGSILLSTHDLIAAEALCDRIAIISRGQKLAEGTVPALKKKYQAKNMEEVFVKVSTEAGRSRKIEKIINNF